MGKKIIFFSKKVKQSINNPEHKKAWQNGVGVGVIAVFILSTILINGKVHAVNLYSYGDYGYYSNTYGGYGDDFDLGTTLSDAIPAAPGSLSCTSTNSGNATCTWSAPTLTETGTSISTGGGSINSYTFASSTSSIASCSGGITGITSTSQSMTGLVQNTIYYIAVCAVDNNLNTGLVATTSFTTPTNTSAGGGGGGGGGGSSTIPATPAVPATPATPAEPGETPATPAVPATPAIPAVPASEIVGDAAKLTEDLGIQRNETAEATFGAKVSASVKEFKVSLDNESKVIATNFVTYGISAATIKLGSGERLALVRDQLETLGRVSLTALEQLASGQKPTDRNLPKEQAQVGKVLNYFRLITGLSKPNFQDPEQDLAWNTMIYRVRFARDLAKERVGIVKFKATFGRIPTSPLDWATVRAWGYALK